MDGLSSGSHEWPLGPRLAKTLKQLYCAVFFFSFKPFQTSPVSIKASFSAGSWSPLALAVNTGLNMPIVSLVCIFNQSSEAAWCLEWDNMEQF